jgi:hypothetical protein
MVAVKSRTAPIAEGWGRFTAGDQILLFTDGIGRRLSTGNRRPEDVACSLAARDAAHPDHTRDLFFAYAKDSAEPDDLTVVVIRTLATARVDGRTLKVVA